LLIGAAFPTPNGPLHLGHLLGPYFSADIMHKTSLLYGQQSKFYCGTFGHQNHMDRTAKSKNIFYEDLAKSSENFIIESFRLFGLEIHSFLEHYPSGAPYEKARDMLIHALWDSPYLIKETVDLPYDEEEQSFVTESYVSGKCPYCDYITIGIECENCGLFQDESILIEPFHTESKKMLSKKRLSAGIFLWITTD
jgi:methionyl-tRNA synthetase